MPCPRVFTCSARRRRLLALASRIAATRRRWHYRSSSCTRTCPQPHRHTPPPALAQQFAHAHAPAAAFFVPQGLSRWWSSLHSHRAQGAGVAGWSLIRYARTGTMPLLGSPALHHARSFSLVSELCPSLVFIRHSFFSHPIRGTPRHASTHARAAPRRTHGRPTTNDTTSRNTKPASYAPARPVPRVRLVCDGHGGAVILAVGHVAFAFVSCATPRGAGTNLNDSDAAA